MISENFDAAPHGWTLTGEAAITDIHGSRSSPNALYLRAFRRPSPAPLTGFSTASKSFTVTPGEPLPVSVFLFGDSASSIRLNLTLDDGIGSTTWTLTASLGFGFLEWEPGTFTPASSSVTVTFNAPAPTSLPPGSLGIFGEWVIDDLQLGSAPLTDVDMKLLDIRDALATRIGTVTIANGYQIDIGEVVKSPTMLKAANAFPQVQFVGVDETKEFHTVGGRMNSVVDVSLAIVAKATADASAMDLALIAYGEIQKAVCLGPGDTGANGMWLGLSYVQGVYVSDSESIDMPTEIERGMAARHMNVRINYHHGRIDP